MAEQHGFKHSSIAAVAYNLKQLQNSVANPPPARGANAEKKAWERRQDEDTANLRDSVETLRDDPLFQSMRPAHNLSASQLVAARALYESMEHLKNDHMNEEAARKMENDSFNFKNLLDPEGVNRWDDEAVAAERGKDEGKQRP